MSQGQSDLILITGGRFRPGRGQATAQEHVFTRCTTRANVAAAQVK